MQLSFSDNLLAIMAPTEAESTGYTPEAEQAARRMGFRNADEMLTFQRNKQVQNGNSQTTGKSGESNTPKKEAPAPKLEGGFGGILNYISKALGGQL